MPPDGSTNDSVSTQTVDELLAKVFKAESSQECLDTATALAEEVKAVGIPTLLKSDAQPVIPAIQRALTDKKSGIARESGLLIIVALARVCGRAASPFLFPLFLETSLELHADKGNPVRVAAGMAAEALLELPHPLSYRRFVLPFLFKVLEDASRRWQCRVAVLESLEQCAKLAPEEVAECLPVIIPKISDCMHTTRKEVNDAAMRCMTAVVGVVGNDDLQAHLPSIVKCMEQPSGIPTMIEKLSATTFVAEVTGPALALLVPLLARALSDRSQLTLRRTSIILNNLCKLVRNPAVAGQFLPQLLSKLTAICDSATFPEVRDLAMEARKTLISVGGEGVESKGTGEKQHEIPLSLLTEEEWNKKDQEMMKVLMKHLEGKEMSTPLHRTLEQVKLVCVEMDGKRSYEKSYWSSALDEYLWPFFSKEELQQLSTKLSSHFLTAYRASMRGGRGSEANEEEEGEELCDCFFSLGYGGRILLSHTNLRLRRGRTYGLLGANGAGKTTLMRAISEGRVEGFPPPTELKTVFVEHRLQGEEASLSLIDFLAADESLKGVSKTEIRDTLISSGFTEDLIGREVGSLSGGWKMKLELSRAMLLNADILLLDEPTNHLDVNSVQSLIDWIKSQETRTCLIVSHDSVFLDAVCTDIIHYEEKKLVNYRGNLTDFAKKRPEAKSYFTLSNEQVRFVFPPPGFLTGVKSNTRAILKMKNVTFTYPGREKPSLINASAVLSLSSRVGIIGKNGAGKSTMIKVLTGEVTPQTGTVWKHPNLRIGYVAQHAFHHIDQHLEETPASYLRWRYALGYDKEVLEKETRVLTAEEREQMEKPIIIDHQKRQVESLLGRQKLKKSYRYEVKWRGLSHKFNTWMKREELQELGFSKLIQRFDDNESSREGLGYRELTIETIRKHFEDVGLEGEIAMNNKLYSLSGGQKVKVVIAAAMWNNPHMLVLDEPTNFIDRDSLGGLAVAIRDWAGAVVIISHNQEFVSALCPEQWHVEDGEVTHKGVCATADANFADDGESKADAAAGGGENGEAASSKGPTADELIEAKAKEKKKKKKKLSRNELKAQAVRRQQRTLRWIIAGGNTAGAKRESDTESD